MLCVFFKLYNIHVISNILVVLCPSECKQETPKIPHTELWSPAVLCGGTLGRGEFRFTFICSELCRGEGGLHGESNWSAGNRAAVGHGGGSVSTIDVNNSSQGSGYVSFGQGWPDHPCCQRSCGEERGCHEVGGGDEEGEEGTMDGVVVWAGLGKEGKLPHGDIV